MSKPMHLVRNIRLQLKTGFMRKEPGTYVYLKRYPPLSRDTATPIRKIERTKIAYAPLYDKIVDENPLYRDEKVYPAFGAHEPRALKLAKKQWQYMESGHSEVEALKMAEIFIDEQENKSFMEMRKNIDALAQGTAVRLPFMSNPEVAVFIAKWKEVLSQTNYEDLDAHAQGDIDYFIQMKILRWNEVERERRMKDPIFVRYFEQFRYSLLHDHNWEERNRDNDRRIVAESMKRYWSISSLSDDNPLTASQPFYYEEYAEYFNKLRAQPLLGHWDNDDRIALSHWVIDTLAIKRVLRKNPKNLIPQYLDQLRAQFFPMIRYPARAKEFKLPDEKEFRRSLYNAGVGYKLEDNAAGAKLFVQRFYTIPRIFFPKETLTTALTADHEKLRSVLESEGSLAEQVELAGVDKSAIPTLEIELREYMSNLQPDTLGALGGRGHSLLAGGSMDMSSLDALLSDDFDSVSAEVSARGSIINDAARAKFGSFDDSLASKHDDSASLIPHSLKQVNPELYSQYMDKHLPQPATELEAERRLLLMAGIDVEEIDCEADIVSLKESLMDIQLISRAQLSNEYERKESARREHSWRARGVVLEDLPIAELSITDSRD